MKHREGKKESDLEVSLYCCWGLNIWGCSLKTRSLCRCSASWMKAKSASVKLFRSMPYTSAPKSTLLCGPCSMRLRWPVV